ncbi:MAG: hypothetical protein Q4G62_08775 [Pseudomonadota bacterium]|nr:hypothetical protein [Pseudomonadota bacterium]
MDANAEWGGETAFSQGGEEPSLRSGSATLLPSPLRLRACFNSRPRTILGALASRDAFPILGCLIRMRFHFGGNSPLADHP